MTVERAPPRGGVPIAAAGAILALVAAAAFLPALMAFRIARRYARIPALALAPLRRLAGDGREAPPLADPRGLAARADGALVVADWQRQAVLAIRAGGAAAAWLPLRGRFEVEFGANGGLYLFDVGREALVRFDAGGRARQSVRVPLAAAPALAAAPEGGVFVSDGARIMRLSAELERVASFAPAPLAGVRGLAFASGRVWAATEDGTLVALSPAGEVVARARLVGNPGRLAPAGGGAVYVADERTGRIWVYDGAARLLGRLAPAPEPGAELRPSGLRATPDGGLAVSGSGGVWAFVREDFR